MCTTWKAVAKIYPRFILFFMLLRFASPFTDQRALFGKEPRLHAPFKRRNTQLEGNISLMLLLLGFMVNLKNHVVNQCVLFLLYEVQKTFYAFNSVILIK